MELKDFILGDLKNLDTQKVNEVLEFNNLFLIYHNSVEVIKKIKDDYTNKLAEVQYKMSKMVVTIDNADEFSKLNDSKELLIKKIANLDDLKNQIKQKRKDVFAAKFSNFEEIKNELLSKYDEYIYKYYDKAITDSLRAQITVLEGQRLKLKVEYESKIKELNKKIAELDTKIEDIKKSKDDETTKNKLISDIEFEQVLFYTDIKSEEKKFASEKDELDQKIKVKGEELYKYKDAEELSDDKKTEYYNVKEKRALVQKMEYKEFAKSTQVVNAENVYTIQKNPGMKKEIELYKRIVDSNKKRKELELEIEKLENLGSSKTPEQIEELKKNKAIVYRLPDDIQVKKQLARIRILIVDNFESSDVIKAESVSEESIFNVVDSLNAVGTILDDKTFDTVQKSVEKSVDSISEFTNREQQKISDELASSSKLSENQRKYIIQKIEDAVNLCRNPLNERKGINQAISIRKIVSEVIDNNEFALLDKKIKEIFENKGLNEQFKKVEKPCEKDYLGDAYEVELEDRINFYTIEKEGDPKLNIYKRKLQELKESKKTAIITKNEKEIIDTQFNLLLEDMCANSFITRKQIIELMRCYDGAAIELKQRATGTQYRDDNDSPFLTYETINMDGQKLPKNFVKVYMELIRRKTIEELKKPSGDLPKEKNLVKRFIRKNDEKNKNIQLVERYKEKINIKGVKLTFEQQLEKAKRLELEEDIELLRTGHPPISERGMKIYNSQKQELDKLQNDLSALSEKVDGGKAKAIELQYFIDELYGKARFEFPDEIEVEYQKNEEYYGKNMQDKYVGKIASKTERRIITKKDVLAEMERYNAVLKDPSLAQVPSTEEEEGPEL